MRIDLSKVPPEHRQEAEELLGLVSDQVKSNPLLAFHPHNDEQAKFLAARTAIIAAFCGNQAGKSTILAVKALVQVLDREWLPEHLLPHKQFDGPVHGWILCPTEDKIFDSIKPALLKWCPPGALKGGNAAKAWNGERFILSFANGSSITFKTYKQDVATLGGATLHFIGYDEPPPQTHRDEAATRTLAVKGSFEMYAMTPLKSNTGWIRREIWRKRAAPHITVCKWSMHDNPYLDPERRQMLLDSYKSDLWRKAREFGDFMDIAGQVYGGLESCVLKATELPPRNFMLRLDHVWGIDPGIRNAAIIAGGFDSHNIDYIYDEMLIQDGTPSQYVQAIDLMLARNGLTRRRVMFVIDPAARQRSQATGDTVQSELARLGIPTVNGNNVREAGQQQIRDRILHKRIFFFPACLGLRDEADEFAWEIDDEDDIGPADDSPFHRLATLRYQTMARPWYPQQEQTAVQRDLGGYRKDHAPVATRLRVPGPGYGPMGKMA